MADTYLSLRLHLVWATKNRRPWLDPEWRPRLFACAAACLERRGGRLLCAGGTRDHIHLYLEPPSTLAPCELVTSIKTTTSKWIHDFLIAAIFDGNTATGRSASPRSMMVGSGITSRTRRFITGNNASHPSWSLCSNATG